MAALLKLNAALNYEDFVDALEAFLAASVSFSSRLIQIGFSDYNKKNYACLLTHEPGASFQPTPGRAAHVERVDEWSRRNPDILIPHLLTHQLGLHGAGSTTEIFRTGYFRRVMEPEQWRDNITVCFRANGGTHSLFWIKRGLDDLPFSAGELRFFEQYYPWLKTAFDRVRLLEDARARNLDIASALFDIPVATFLLDWDFALQQHNAAAARACAVWTLGPARARALKPPAMSAAAVPAEIRAACAALRERWLEATLRLGSGTPARAAAGAGVGAGAGVAAAGAGARHAWRGSVAHPEHPRLEATVTLLRPGVQRLARPSFLVRINEITEATTDEGATENERRARRVQLLARLTQAERALVPLAARGMSDKEIAVALGKSVPTVKNQLRSIYEKLRVPNRARLIALAR